MCRTPSSRLARWIPLALLLAAATQLAACAQHYLVATPYVIGEEGTKALETTPQAYRTPDMPIFYVTDRAKIGEDAAGPTFGDKRSDAMTYGIATVGVTPEAGWDRFAADSTSFKRSQAYTLSVKHVEPLGEVSPLADRLTVVDHRLALTPEAKAAAIKQGQELDAAFQPYLDAGMDEVFIYVHGVGNTFEDAVDRTAEIWHYTGRQFIPICYTWPSESRFGLLPYNRDRESSEFTVLHFILFLRALTLDPKIKRVNIVAHSRGTWVVASAISRIYAQWHWGAGKDVQKMYKLHTVLLAAPDIDKDVFREQFMAQNAVSASDRFIMYFSPNDAAVGLSTWLMGGERLGRLKLTNFKPQFRRILTEVPSIELINCLLTNTSSHSYAFEHPSAFSDVILILRDDAYAGTKERPLEEPDPSIWQITDAYLRPWGWPIPRIHP